MSDSFSDPSSDSLLNILAHCWRSDLPSISATNRALHSVNKEQLYKLRRANGLVEHWLLIYDSAENVWSVYDPYKNVWYTIPRMPFEHSRIDLDFSVICVGSELLFLASHDEMNAEIYRFQLLTNTWISNERVERFSYGWAAEGNLALLAGGVGSEKKTLASAELYNSDTGLWTPILPMNHARSNCTGAFMDGKFYMIGGHGVGNRNGLTSAEVYDIHLKTWSVIENFLPEGFANRVKSIAVANNEMYLAHSEVEGGQVLMYSKSSNQWLVKGVFPDERPSGFLDYQLSSYRPTREPVEHLLLTGVRVENSTKTIHVDIFAAAPAPVLQWILLATKPGSFAPLMAGVMGC